MQNSQTKLKKFLYPGNFKHYETTVNSYLSKSSSNFFITSNKQVEKKNPLKSVYSISESTAFSDSIPLLQKRNYHSFKNQKSEVSKAELFPFNESEITHDASDLNSEQIKINKFKNYLSFLGKKSNFNDIASFKNKTFSDIGGKNGQDKDYDHFDIFYGADKRRSTLLKDLNHRLFYKKTKGAEAFDNNFSTKLLEMKSKSFKIANDRHIEEKFIESSLMKRRSLKKIGSFSPKNKKKNIFSKIKPIDTNVAKNIKNQVILPSSNRLKFKAEPLLLLKSISDHINNLKAKSCKISTFEKVKSIFFDLKDIESCFFDTDCKVFLDLPSPKDLYDKILLVEKSRKNENSILKKKSQKINSLWLYDPLAKLSAESFNLLFSANFKLEQIRIDMEKENFKKMKDDLINRQEAVLEEKLRLLDVFKKKNKKHLYEIIKKDVENSHNMNLSLPMSNISENLNKCEGKFGKLKRINKISKEALRNMETTIFEIKNYETKMNEKFL